MKGERPGAAGSNMGSNQKRTMTRIRAVAAQVIKSRRTEDKSKQREKTRLGRRRA